MGRLCRLRIDGNFGVQKRELGPSQMNSVFLPADLYAPTALICAILESKFPGGRMDR
jgi:hypothetical protein